jgi:hypothetical protein
MSTRLTGQLAIASGLVGIVATAVLIAFYILEAPQAVAAGAQTSRLGAINDVLGGVQFLLLVPVAATLRFNGDRLGLFAAIAGITGLAGAAVAAELYVVGLIGSEIWYPVAAAGDGLIGVWIGSIALLGRTGYLSRGLTRLGVATGAGMLMIPLGIFLLGGLGALTDPRVALHNYPFLVTIAIGIVATAIGVPAWSMWLGRHLLIGENSPPRGKVGAQRRDSSPPSA